MEILADKKTLRLLFIEDNIADAELLLRAMKREGLSIQHKIVKNPTQLKTALLESWDIIFLDYNVPGYGTLAAIDDIRSADKETPIIVVSGAVGEDLAVEALKAGADDFLVKGKWNRLGSAVRRSLREKQSRLMSRAAQRDREEILAVVSHDLRNPLSAVQLNLQQMQAMYEKGNLRPGENEHLESLMLRAQKSLRRMRFLIDDILDETKIAVGRFRVERQSFSINQILSDLEEVFRPLALRKDLDFEVIPTEDNLTGVFDPDRIFQALGNIIGNAIKFTNSGGKIKIWCRRESDRLKLFISDTGKGIPADDLDHVFDRYWQTHTAEAGSLGLGLFIVKGIIDAHDGTIKVESKPDKGTTFEICIPTDDSSKNEIKTQNHHPYTKKFLPQIKELFCKAVPNLGEILIVDDDEDMRFVLKEIFTHEGFKVFESGDAASTDDVLKLAKNLKLVLLDYQVSGTTTDKMINKFKVPVVLVSAIEDLDKKAREMGVERYLRKPIDRNVIIDTVKDILKIK